MISAVFDELIANEKYGRWAICIVSLWLENKFIASGIPEKDAAAYVVIIPKSTSIFIK